MPKNRCKVLVLTLILASMTASGCANNGFTAQTTVQAAETQSTAGTAAAVTETQSAVDTTEADAQPEATDRKLEDSEAEAYVSELKNEFHKYMNASLSFSTELEAGNFGNAKKCLDDMDAALTGFEHIVVPPECTELQTNIVLSLDSEREYVNNCRKIVGFFEKGDSLTDSDREEVERINNALDNAPSDFTDAYLNAIKALKKNKKDI